MRKKGVPPRRSASINTTPRTTPSIQTKESRSATPPKIPTSTIYLLQSPLLPMSVNRTPSFPLETDLPIPRTPPLPDPQPPPPLPPPRQQHPPFLPTHRRSSLLRTVPPHRRTRTSSWQEGRMGTEEKDSRMDYCLLWRIWIWRTRV